MRGAAAVYEIDGRLLLQTVHRSGRAGISERHVDVLDGYPDVTAEALGDAIGVALARSREIPWPASWPTMREVTAPHLASSPRRYRSWRSWQRAARYVSVHVTADAVHLRRWLPDLGGGGWEPRPVDAPGDGWTYDLTIGGDATPAGIGTAVLTLLESPPLRD
ncbi:hypothetical protein AB0J72_21695 [Dactylosporangium sp. NPDC049742]|uniref:hypothetical protein n=1 Tax=Dactylosporangium sp. NPDC049742 TaxID=3154737 RepID=UPI0034493AA3